MSQPWNGAQSDPGERWNVNVPAVVGVVFVLFVGVVIWVIASSGSGGDDAVSGDDTISSIADSTSSTTAVPTLPPPTTSALPMPVTTPPGSVVATSAAPTTPPTAAPTVAPTPPPAPPATQPPGSPGTAAPEQGDLGVPGHPIQRPPCEGAYITVLASAIGGQATPASMDAVLDEYPGSSYLRTDLTCPSLTQSQNGDHIYVVYLGPFVTDTDACTARADGPNGSYVRRLSNDLGPSHSVTCD